MFPIFLKISNLNKFEEHKHILMQLAIETYSSQENDFKNSVGVIVERGLNLTQRYKTNLNSPESLNSKIFSEKKGIQISVIDT